MEAWRWSEGGKTSFSSASAHVWRLCTVALVSKSREKSRIPRTSSYHHQIQKYPQLSISHKITGNPAHVVLKPLVPRLPYPSAYSGTQPRVDHPSTHLSCAPDVVLPITDFIQLTVICGWPAECGQSTRVMLIASTSSMTLYLCPSLPPIANPSTAPGTHFKNCRLIPVAPRGGFDLSYASRTSQANYHLSTN